MDKLFVAWQDEESREWIPVAALTYDGDIYRLTYTQGVKRCRNFVGFGRMTALNKEYTSDSLFPFFANRLVSKSRPEYKNYLRWLGLDETRGDPMTIMAVTGGLRATDSFEMIPLPKRQGSTTVIDFFARGLRYLQPAARDVINALSSGDQLYLLRDIQNNYDAHALLLRTGDPKTLVGHIPKYYCAGLNLLLDSDKGAAEVRVRRANPDAPFDMALLCTLTISSSSDIQILECENDFLSLELGEKSDITKSPSKLGALDLGAPD